jgi:succinyl-diaminopimelate desuccinylase
MRDHAEALDLLRQLVRADTTSGRSAAQREAQELAASYATAVAGVSVLARSGGELPWLLLGTGETAGVLFVCHVDTVPVGEHASWSRDPLSADVDGDVLHGRGSVDMKGGLVAALEALRAAAAAGTAARVLLTSDEEAGCRGAARAATELELAPELVVVPEATDNRVSLGHRGATWLRLRATGRAAHGSAPDRGINAIRLLADRALSALDTAPLSQREYLGNETLNVGTISGGTATNIVPAAAELTLDVRTVDGGEAVIGWARKLDAAIDVDVELDLPAVHTSALPDSLTGQPVGPAATYFTDAAPLRPVLGGAPVVIWGPGDPTQMHAADERLELTSWREAVDSFRALTAGAW